MWERLTSAALLETLDSVVSPAVRDAILRSALAVMAEPVVPSDGPAFCEFVRGPLRRALAANLGEAMAETLVADLERLGSSIPPGVQPSGPRPPTRRRSTPRPSGGIPGRATRSLTPPAHRSRHSSLAPQRRSPSGSGRRPTPRPQLRSSELPPPSCPEAESCAGATRHIDPLPALPDLHAHLDEHFAGPPSSGPISGPAARSPFGSAEYPAAEETSGEGPTTVVVATRDRRLLRTLTEWLVDRARVVNVSNVLDLVQHASQPGVLVVVDCNRPAVRPAAVAALAEELSTQNQVVLWGPSVDDEDSVRALSAVTDRWIRCHSVAAVSLARRCVELVS